MTDRERTKQGRCPRGGAEQMVILAFNALHMVLIFAGPDRRGGVLVAAAEEERFRRLGKHWAGFPTQAIFDCAHGRNHFSFPDDREGARSGFSARHDLDRPDLDQRHTGDRLGSPRRRCRSFCISACRSTTLCLRATAAPAKIMGYEGTVGTLRPGANADIALLELRTGNFSDDRQRRQHGDGERNASLPA